MAEINKNENILEDNNNKESKEEELLSESDTDDIQLEANGDNKIIFLSKEEINKIKEKKKQKEEYIKKEKEKLNARHKRLYLRTKNRYLKKLEKEKEEENKKYKQKEEENDEEEKEKEKNIGKNLSKKEKNKLIELKQIKEYYIGKEGPKIIKKKENKPKEMIKDFFVFDWKDTEDTTNEKKNFLPKMTPKIMFGKGIVGGLENKDDMKDYYNFDEEERKKQLFRLKKRKNDENKSISESVSDNEHRSRSRERNKDKNNNNDDKDKDKNDKKKEKELIKNAIKKRIQPKLNDGTKKFNWKDFNTIYKY